MVLGFPRLYAAASLKLLAVAADATEVLCFPRLYAAASLKPETSAETLSMWLSFSAALCRGLIEAPNRSRSLRGTGAVFRGSMPRPH